MRLNVYDYSSPETSAPIRLAGWFDASKAEFWSDADCNGNGSRGVGRGTGLYRTAAGRWVAVEWSNWQHERDYRYFVEPAEAREWLMMEYQDDAVRDHFGQIPTEMNLSENQKEQEEWK